MRAPREATRVAVGWLILLLAAGVAPASAQSPTSGTTPPAEVTSEFDRICHAMTSGANLYYGTEQVVRLREAISGATDPLEEVELRRALARELLRVGEADQAAEELDRALRLATEQDVAVDSRFWMVLELAVSLLRLGELTNCVQFPRPEMCVFPIGPGGRHPDPEAARKSLELFRGVLELTPDLSLAAWLANIAAMSIGEFPDALPVRHRVAPSRLIAEGDIGRFPNVAHAVGLQIETLSGGAIVDDFDGDGYLDVLTSSSDPCEPLHFFRNDGSGRFVESTAAAGLTGQLGGLNLVQADYDNDGNLDVLVLRGGWLGADGRMRNSLLRNRGDGTFVDVTAEAGLATYAYPTQTASWADYDNDGDLDLYVGNEGDAENLDDPAQLLIEGAEIYPAELYRNEGDGTFSEVAAEAGVTNDRFAKGVTWADFDNDGNLDLYVSNIGPNRLYRNNGDGTFKDVASALRVTEPSAFSFATWAFDYDNDGDQDLFVADYDVDLQDIAAHYLGEETTGGRPVLYENTGRGFVDVGARKGLVTPTLPMGANFGDLDNDGFLDFYLGTGLPNYEALIPNLMYRNVGGERFEDVTFSGGFGHLQKGHGVAFADLDNDGDQDVFEQMGGAFPGDAAHSVLYRNPGHDRPWLRLQLVGRRSSRSAIGARVKVIVNTPEGRRAIFRSVTSGGSFGGSPLRFEVGLGEALSIEAVDVWWPAGGEIQRFRGLGINESYTLVERE